MKPYKNSNENENEKVVEKRGRKTRNSRRRNRFYSRHPHEEFVHLSRTTPNLPSRLLETSFFSTSSDDCDLVNQRQLQSFMISRLRRSQISQRKMRQPSQNTKADVRGFSKGEVPQIHSSIEGKSGEIVGPNQRVKQVIEYEQNKAAELISLEEGTIENNPFLTNFVFVDDDDDFHGKRERISLFSRERSPVLLQQIDRVKEGKKNSVENLKKRIQNMEVFLNKQNSEIQRELKRLGIMSSGNNDLSYDFNVFQEKATENLYQENYEFRRLLRNRESRNRLTLKIPKFFIFYSLVTLLGILIMILTFLWTHKYRLNGFPRTFHDWHPFLSIVAFLFLYSQSILVHSNAKHFTKKIMGKFLLNSIKLHQSLQILTYVVGFLAILSAFYSEQHPHFHSLHSWMGLGSFLLFCLTFSISFSLFFPNLPFRISTKFLTLYETACFTCFILMILTNISGLMETIVWDLREQYYFLPIQGVLVNVIGISMIIFAGFVIFLVRESR